MGSKFRLTQSLISAYEWMFKKEDGYDEFIAALNREKKQPTVAMLDGIRYENCLNSVLDGAEITPDHEWYKPITEMAEELQGAQQQVTIFRDINVDGVDFLIHGVLDYLRAGEIWDCKFSKNYKLNKYLGSPQTAFYMYLVPEARRFTYIVSDGTWVYRERYPREIVEPIEPYIKNFMQFLDMHNLVNIYTERWSVR